MENLLIKQRKERIVQGERIRLPSKGIFYKNEEIDEEVKNGEITCYPMTTLDEIIIRTVHMLTDGSGVFKVIGRCCPQVLKPTELLAKDVDFILTQLRKITYGDNLSIPFACPNTENSEENIYNVSVNQFIAKTKELDEMDLKSYKINLNDGFLVKLRPAKYKEIIEINEKEDSDDKSPEEKHDLLIMIISSMIESVQNVTDQQDIKEWLKTLFVKEMEELLAKMPDINNMGTDFTCKITCNDCNKEHDITYIMNPVSFFILPSNLEIKRN